MCALRHTKATSLAEGKIPLLSGKSYQKVNPTATGV